MTDTLERLERLLEEGTKGRWLRSKHGFQIVGDNEMQSVSETLVPRGCAHRRVAVEQFVQESADVRRRAIPFSGASAGAGVETEARITEPLEGKRSLRGEGMFSVRVAGHPARSGWGRTRVSDVPLCPLCGERPKLCSCCSQPVCYCQSCDCDSGPIQEDYNDNIEDVDRFNEAKGGGYW